MPDRLLEELAEGRTELVFDLIAQGRPAGTKDEKGVSPIQHCAFYGDVSAIKFLWQMESLIPWEMIMVCTQPHTTAIGASANSCWNKEQT